MKWIGISGSWRNVNPQIEQDVRRDVAAIIGRGDGIVTGGALGVDFIATDEALKQDPTAARLKIILPTPLATYQNHFLKRSAEGVITVEQAQTLAAQLQAVRARRKESLVELFYSVCTPETYYARNTAVIEACDTLLAYQVNGSAGTQDAIDKARRLNKPVTHRQYKFEP